MKYHYKYEDIVRAYREVGVAKGRIVSVRTDLRYLGAYESMERDELLSAHFNALAELVDLDHGTIVVPTASTSLCNTDTIFDPDYTPSETGVLTEYIRKLPGAVRSFHPFVSSTAIGKHAEDICLNVARQGFGPETPTARMIEMDALEVSIGMNYHRTCNAVHHVELVMCVPYRYAKEFHQPVIRNGETGIEPFYLYVWYRECDIEREGNKKIFQRFNDEGYRVKDTSLGRGHVYSYSLKEFYQSTVKAFRDDIYVFLERVPKNKPYLV